VVKINVAAENFSQLVGSGFKASRLASVAAYRLVFISPVRTNKRFSSCAGQGAGFEIRALSINYDLRAVVAK